MQLIKKAFGFKRNFRSLYERGAGDLAALDGLRALSILWVLVFHVYFLTVLVFSQEFTRQLVADTPWYFNWIWNGDKGVDIFFVMSGFLISGLLFREFEATGGINLKSFYIRRFLRLTPVYWTALLIYVAAQGPNASNAWTNALYVNNIIPSSEMAMTWTWSLAVEEQFYLFFPLFLLSVFFASARKWTWLFGLLILSCVTRLLVLLNEPGLMQADLKDIFDLSKNALFERYFDALYVNLYTRFGPFICGIMAAHAYFNHQDRVRTFFVSGSSGWFVGMGVLLTAGFALASSYQQDIEYTKAYQIFYIVFSRILFGVGIAIILLAALFNAGWVGRAVSGFLSWRIWVPLARLSYSIYIFHIFFIGFLLMNLKANLKAMNLDAMTVGFWGMMPMIPLALAGSALIALFFYLLIEKPFMNLRTGFHPVSKQT